MIDEKAYNVISEYLFNFGRGYFIQQSNDLSSNLFDPKSQDKQQTIFDYEKDLMKTIYYSNPDFIDLPGNGNEFVEQMLENIPLYGKDNILYAHKLATTISEHPDFLAALRSDPLGKHKEDQSNKGSDKGSDTGQSLEDVVEEALDGVNCQFGLSKTPTRGETQDAVVKEALDPINEGIEELLQEVIDAQTNLENAEHDPEQIARGMKASKAELSEAVKACATKIAFSSRNLQRLQQTLQNISAVSDAILKGLDKVEKSHHSTQGFAYGRNLRKTIRKEFIPLADSRYSEKFMVKFAKGELVEESEKTESGIGDMIIAIDTSASTFSPCYQGEIIELELGIGAAIASVAIKNKCKVKFVFFHTIVYNTSHWIKTKTQLNTWLANINSDQSFFRRGGTSFNAALTAQLKIIEELPSRTKNKPGLIFICDGADKVSSYICEAMLKQKKERKFKFYSYFCCRHDPREGSEEIVDISDSSYWVNASRPISDQVNLFLDIK